MQKLERLNNFPLKVYNVDNNNNWELLKDEGEEDKVNGGKLNTFIKNYSGGVSIGKIHGAVKSLRTGYYNILPNEISGDAPKDFIQVYEYGETKQASIKEWSKHIAKIGHKWYPLESVSEHLINRIGDVLGLNMAVSQLRVAHGQLRFLSKYFLQDDENMIHGAQIYSGFLSENDDRFVQEIEENKWSRALFTFQFTNESVKFMFPDQHQNIMNQLVKLLVFDAISGNNDRHFYNWAIITDITGQKTPKFSPIYDSARGLFWNRSEKNIEEKFFEGKGKKIRINQAALMSYINSSRPKIGWEDWQNNKEINHFQLIELINETYPPYNEICKRLLKNVNLQAVLNLLQTEFITFYTPKRYSLISECLKQRFALLQKLCKINCDD